MIILRGPGCIPQPERPTEDLYEEMLEAFTGPVTPTFATGGVYLKNAKVILKNAEITYKPEDGGGILWNPDDIRKFSEPVTVTTTFEMTGQQFRGFYGLVFGVYRLPGDKALIHKGKKP